MWRKELSAFDEGLRRGDAGLKHILFPGHPNLVATQPAGSANQSFVLEVILTWWLMLVILFVSHGAKEKGITAGIVIGAVVALEACFAGPIRGASMNPACSFGPALVWMRLETLWIYLAAPVLGGALAVFTYRLMGTRPLTSSNENLADSA